MLPVLAKSQDLVPVWVSAGDFCALGFLPSEVACDERIHVLVPLPYSIVQKLWRMGRGQNHRGEPLVADDGRLILALNKPKNGAVFARPLRMFTAAASLASAPAMDSIDLNGLHAAVALARSNNEKIPEVLERFTDQAPANPSFVARSLLENNYNQLGSVFHRVVEEAPFVTASVASLVPAWAGLLQSHSRAISLSVTSVFLSQLAYAQIYAESKQINKCIEAYLYQVALKAHSKYIPLPCQTVSTAESSEFLDSLSYDEDMARYFEDVTSRADDVLKILESSWEKLRIGGKSSTLATTIGALRSPKQPYEYNNIFAYVAQNPRNVPMLADLFSRFEEAAVYRNFSSRGILRLQQQNTTQKKTEPTIQEQRFMLMDIFRHFPLLLYIWDASSLEFGTSVMIMIASLLFMLLSILYLIRRMPKSAVATIQQNFTTLLEQTKSSLAETKENMRQSSSIWNGVTDDTLDKVTQEINEFECVLYHIVTRIELYKQALEYCARIIKRSTDPQQPMVNITKGYVYSVANLDNATLMAIDKCRKRRHDQNGRVLGVKRYASKMEAELQQTLDFLENNMHQPLTETTIKIFFEQLDRYSRADALKRTLKETLQPDQVLKSARLSEHYKNRVVGGEATTNTSVRSLMGNLVNRLI
jgi:hypothetical protein